jgi:hypothetical protein
VDVSPLPPSTHTHSWIPPFYFLVAFFHPLFAQTETKQINETRTIVPLFGIENVMQAHISIVYSEGFIAFFFRFPLC